MQTRFPSSPWWRLLPLEGGLQDAILTALASELDREGTRSELAALAASNTYPRPVLERLRRLGMAALFADPQRATAWHLCGLNEITAQVDGSLAITVGVNSLALLPIWIAGSDAIKAKVAARLRDGAAASLLLTELANGSNLGRTQTRAEAGTRDGESFAPGVRSGECASWYRLRGEKHLINGAREHELLVTLARTRGGEPGSDDRFGGLTDLSVFLVDRARDVTPATCKRLPRWNTLPAQGADISGVRFDDALIPAENLIGQEGEGLLIVHRTLAISRGGIGALAAGTAARACELTLSRARTRNLYGSPILSLGAISAHVLRSELAATAAAALSLKSAAFVNAYGQAAAGMTATAKLACCALAEEAVIEGRRVHGSQALLREHPYERLVRDVTLFPVFDGTSHLMLEQLSAQLGRAPDEPKDVVLALEALGEPYREAPRPLPEVLVHCAIRHAPLALEARARALASAGEVDAAPLVPLCRVLLDVVVALKQGGLWDDQALRFHAALSLAFLEAVFATLELSDPARRRAMWLPTADLGELDVRRARLVLSWLGGRVARRVRELALSCGLSACVRELPDVEEQIRKDEAATARAHRAAL